MDYLRELGALALASRMKRLVSRLNQDVKAIYAEQQIAFEPLLMPITRLLEAKDQLQASEIATALGVSQPAVTQMCNRLKKHGLIAMRPHLKDRRIREIALLPAGREFARTLAPIWREIESAVVRMVDESEENLLDALEAFEEQCQRRPLRERVLEQLARQQAMHIDIVPYDDSLKDAFERLNLEWIKKDFTVEPSDQRVLSNPRQYILDPGGAIYFAQSGDEVVGTYALLHVDAQTYELAKMAVTATYQRRGIGTALLGHALAQARALGIRRLILYSNTRLAPALNLYFAKGFRVIPKDDHHNDRANIKMELDLKPR